MKCCMFAGINISGVNAEVMPAQWEYQASRGAGWDSAACRGQACRAHRRRCQPAPTCSSALLAPPCAAALCRWAPAPASPWATTCGCLATSCTAWRSCTTWRSPSTPRCSCWCLPAASTGGAAHMLQCAACQAPAPAVCSCLGCPPCSAPHMQPIPGDWNGAGGHTNFSSKSTRQAETGWQAIQDQVRGVELQINEWLLHVHPLCLPAVHATPASHSSMCVPACSFAQASMLLTHLPAPGVFSPTNRLPSWRGGMQCTLRRTARAMSAA